MGARTVIVLGALAAFVLTYALVRPSIGIAKRLGAIDMPGGRRVHTKPTTRMGGIAIYFGMIVPLAIIFALCKAGLLPAGLLPATDINLLGVLAGITVIFITGCIDDVRQIPIHWKVLGQIAAAAIVAFSGVMPVGLRTYTGDAIVDFGLLSWLITVFWLVAFANVVNLIDGLDGLAAGVCAISSTSLFVLAIITSNWTTALCTAIMLATCLAFLRFNYYPAKLFMGDSGSLTLGFTLGIISMLGVMKVSTFTSFIVPIIIAGIPIIDTAAAIVRRRMKHESIGEADKEHIHHNLMRLGYDQRKVVLTIYALCVVFAVSGIVIVQNGMAVRIAVIVVDMVVAVFLVWHLKLFGGVLEHFYGRNERQQGERLADAARGGANDTGGKGEGCETAVITGGPAVRPDCQGASMNGNNGSDSADPRG